MVHESQPVLFPVRGPERAHLKELVEVLLKVLDEVGVVEFGQHHLLDLLGEGHLGLGQPRPVERVWE